MVGEEVIGNVTATFPKLEGAVGTLVTVLKIIGGVIGVYIIFWIINSFINARRAKTMKRILQNLEEINAKLGPSKTAKTKSKSK